MVSLLERLFFREKQKTEDTRNKTMTQSEVKKEEMRADLMPIFVIAIAVFAYLGGLIGVNFAMDKRSCWTILKSNCTCKRESTNREWFWGEILRRLNSESEDADAV